MAEKWTNILTGVGWQLWCTLTAAACLLTVSVLKLVRLTPSGVEFVRLSLLKYSSTSFVNDFALSQFQQAEPNLGHS